MFRVVSGLSALVLAASLAVPSAQAQVILPNPTTFTTTGQMNAFYPGFDCQVSMTIDVPASGAGGLATVTSASALGPGSCDTVEFLDLPWQVSVGSGSRLYINGFNLRYFTGGSYTYCSPGYLDVHWQHGGVFPNNGGYYFYNGSGCTILGVMQVTSGTPIYVL